MTAAKGPDVLGGFETRLLSALTVVDGQRQASTRIAQPVRSRLRLTFPVMAALAGLLILGATVVAELDNPASFQPAGDVLVAGGSTYLKGSGCAASSKVTFTLDGKTELGSTTADRNGQFSVGVPVPAGTPPGPHDLAAACTNDSGDQFVQHARVTVVESMPRMGPSLSLGGDVIAGGSTFVKGSGCAAGSNVAFTLDGKTQLGVTTASSDGLFMAQLNIPRGDAIGSHDLTATCEDTDGTSLVQHTMFAVVIPQPGQPTPTK